MLAKILDGKDVHGGNSITVERGQRLNTVTVVRLVQNASDRLAFSYPTRCFNIPVQRELACRRIKETLRSGSLLTMRIDGFFFPKTCSGSRLPSS